MNPLPRWGPRRAVVVGGGIGGLAAAIGLRRVGWPATVLERSSRPGGIGAGVSLWSNALDALDALGVGEAIREAGGLQLDAGVRRPDGRWLIRGSGAALQQAGVELLMVHRAQLHRHLLAALPADTVLADATVTDLEPAGDGVVVGYDTPTGHAEVEAGLVVGADGVHSTVRAQHWPEAPSPAYAGFTAWRGVTTEPVELDAASETWGRGAEFGLVPLVDRRVYWFGTADLPPGADFADEHTEVLRRFGAWHDPIGAVITATAPEAVLHHDIYQYPRPLPPMGHDRVALLGDAAHTMTPNLGQGACIALEDAVTLAAALSDADDPSRAVLDYDTRRRGRAETLVKRSAQAGRILQATSPAGVALRNLLARATPTRYATSSIARVVRWTPPRIHGRADARDL